MKLTTAENFLLLAQHPYKGRFFTSGIYINYGIIGALVLDMVLEQKVEIENNRLILKTRKQGADPIESEIVSMLQRFRKPLSVRRSIHKFSGKARKLKKSLLRQLARKGYIRIEEKNFLGFIPIRRHYLTNFKARNELIGQLKSNLLHEKELSNKNAVLLGLIEACKLHKVLTSRKEELKIIRKQLRETMNENAVALSVDKNIRQVQAAILGAVVISAVAAGNSR